jgi:hypothetical protein
MKTTENFAPWADWFRDFQSRQLPIPWDSLDRIQDENSSSSSLTPHTHTGTPRTHTGTPRTHTGPSLHAIVRSSVRQFQLGESSEARNLKAKVARYAKRTGNSAYQDAMEWFIFEENRHSRLLGRFMAGEDMPKAHNQFTDHLFRLARHTVGLRNSITILLSAELVAVPYYTALRDATSSPILTAISQQILHDENMHIRFQARAIRMLLHGKKNFRRRLARRQARLMLEFALRVLWLNHAPLLRLAGYRFQDLHKEALQQFHWAWDIIEGRVPDPDPSKAGTAAFEKRCREEATTR